MVADMRMKSLQTQHSGKNFDHTLFRFVKDETINIEKSWMADSLSEFFALLLNAGGLYLISDS